MYQSELRDQISQGDIFDNIPLAIVAVDEQGEPSVKHQPVQVMLISYDCDYDKRDGSFALVAQVRPLSAVREESRGNLQQGRVLRAIYLPALPDLLEESYVELRNIGMVAKALLESRSQKAQRLVSLTDESREHIQERIALFFGLKREERAQPYSGSG